ncbi:GLPGLI family protein [uncultured Chryseobacterium sp.]|uniref:GLPGLI family protein n=1 Tax=uncultured Chryseobacterium sp. TaxID=259322 RepID=UPI0025F60D82|nr:GLPGLI family protein [uncultured Chryseobacterium sp.]
MKKIISALLLSAFWYASAQSKQIHVQYTFVRSPIAVLNENLYIRNNKVISIQDSVFTKPVQETSEWISEVQVKAPGSGKPQKRYYISDLKEGETKHFFFNSSPYSLKDQTNYFIHDEVPKPVWNIDEKSTRKILGYSCIKATTVFRGTNITAYFTRELPYPAGPFKFFGLPGLILDVREDGLPYMIWKATAVDPDDTTNINFEPEFRDDPKITMKEFVRKNDELSSQFKSEILKNLPAGTKMESSKKRDQLEKVFEWENTK